MIQFDIGQLHDWTNAFLWPFLRILALIGVAPVLGESTVPVRLKIGVAALMAVALAPTLGSPPPISPGSYAGVLLAAQQVLIGISLGLVMRLAFAAVLAAGEIIGLQMGLSFASFFDHGTGGNTAVLSRIMNLLAMLTFLSIDGHLLLLGCLAHSFDTMPIRTGWLDIRGWGVLFAWSSQVATYGILLALPLIITLLTINLALGILNRTAQQLSVFAVGFPVSLLSGLVLLCIVLPQTAPFLARLFDSAYKAMARLSLALAGG